MWAQKMNANIVSGHSRLMDCNIHTIFRYWKCTTLVFIAYLSFSQNTFAQPNSILESKAEKTCAENPIIGRVYNDKNANGYLSKGEAGIAGVNLYTAQGLQVTTDDKGRFHIACIPLPHKTIGSNFILKLDEKSLPPAHHLTSENPRIIRMTSSLIRKVNFGVAPDNVISLELTDAAFDSKTDILKDEFSSQLPDIIEALSGQKSTLHLTYYPSANGNRERLDKLNTKIQTLWKLHGDDYDLNIERKTVWQEENHSQAN